ncbi:hypothetical protein MPSEU_000675100 [Mayamaea pseudoterrestris]|nr:hypothetical protein MPSEU_000675100 [Mayamaea pseudoterrestris]
MKKQQTKPVAHAVVTRPRPSAAAAQKHHHPPATPPAERKGLFPSLLGKTKSSTKNATKLVPFTNKTVLPPVNKINMQDQEDQQSKMSSLSDPEGIIYQLDPQNSPTSRNNGGAAAGYNNSKAKASRPVVNRSNVPKAVLHKPAAANVLPPTDPSSNHYHIVNDKVSTQAHTFVSAPRKVMQLHAGMQLSAPSPITLDKVAVQKQQEKAMVKLQAMKKKDAPTTQRPAHTLAHAVPVDASLMASKQQQEGKMDLAMNQQQLVVATPVPTETNGNTLTNQQQQPEQEQPKPSPADSKKDDKSKKIAFDKVRALLNRMGNGGTTVGTNSRTTSTLPSVVTTSHTTKPSNATAANTGTNSSKTSPASAISTQESMRTSSIAQMYSQITNGADQSITTRDPSPLHSIGTYPRVAFPPIQSPPKMSKTGTVRGVASPGQRVPVDAPDVLPPDQLRPDADGVTLDGGDEEEDEWMNPESASMVAASSVNVIADEHANSPRNIGRKAPPSPMKRVEEHEDDEDTSKSGDKVDADDSYAMSNPLNIQQNSSHESYLMDDANDHELPDPSPRAKQEQPDFLASEKASEYPQAVETRLTPEVINVMTPRADDSPCVAVHTSNPFDDNFYDRTQQPKMDLDISDPFNNVEGDDEKKLDELHLTNPFDDDASANRRDKLGAEQHRSFANKLPATSGSIYVNGKDERSTGSKKQGLEAPSQTRPTQDPIGSTANFVQDSNKEKNVVFESWKQPINQTAPKPRYTISKLIIPVANDSKEYINQEGVKETHIVSKSDASAARAPRPKLKVETVDSMDDGGIPLPAVDSSAMMAALELSLSPNSNKVARKKKNTKSPRKLKKQQPNSPLMESPRFTNSPRINNAKTRKGLISRKLAKTDQAYKAEAVEETEVNHDEDRQTSFPREIALSTDENVSDLDQSLRYFPMREVRAHGSVDVSALDRTRDDGTISSKEDPDRYARSLESPDKYAPLLSPLPPLHFKERRTVRISSPVKSGKALADSLSEDKVTWSVEGTDSAETSQVAVEVMLNACNQTPLGKMLVNEISKPWSSTDYPNDAEKILNEFNVDRYQNTSSVQNGKHVAAMKETPKITNTTTRSSAYFFSEGGASPSRHKDPMAHHQAVDDSDDEFENMLRVDIRRTAAREGGPKSPDPAGRDAASVAVLDSPSLQSEMSLVIVRKTSSNAFVNENGDRYHVAEAATDVDDQEHATDEENEEFSHDSQQLKDSVDGPSTRDDGTKNTSGELRVDTYLSQDTDTDRQTRASCLTTDRSQLTPSETKNESYLHVEAGNDRTYSATDGGASLDDRLAGNNASQEAASLYRSLGLTTGSDDSSDDDTTDKYAAAAEVVRDETNIDVATGEQQGCDSKSAFVSNLLAFGHNFLGLSPTKQGELASKIEALSPKSKGILEKSIEKAKSADATKLTLNASMSDSSESDRLNDAAIVPGLDESVASSKMDNSTLSSRAGAFSTTTSRVVENLEAVEEEEDQSEEDVSAPDDIIDLTGFASFDDNESKAVSEDVWYFEGTGSSKQVHGTKLDDVFHLAADPASLHKNSAESEQNEELQDPLIVVKGQDVEVAPLPVHNVTVESASPCSESTSQTSVPLKDYSSFDTEKVRNTRSRLAQNQPCAFLQTLSMISETHDRYAVEAGALDESAEKETESNEKEETENQGNRDFEQDFQSDDQNGVEPHGAPFAESQSNLHLEVQAVATDSENEEIEIVSTSSLKNNQRKPKAVFDADKSSDDICVDADVLSAEDQMTSIPSELTSKASVTVGNCELEISHVDSSAIQGFLSNRSAKFTERVLVDADADVSRTHSLPEKYTNGVEMSLEDSDAHQMKLSGSLPCPLHEASHESSLSATDDDDTDGEDIVEHVVIEPPIRLFDWRATMTDNKAAVTSMKQRLVDDAPDGPGRKAPTPEDLLAMKRAWRKQKRLMRGTKAKYTQENETRSNDASPAGATFSPAGLFATLMCQTSGSVVKKTKNNESLEERRHSTGPKELSNTGNDLLDFLCDNAESMLCGQTTDVLEKGGFEHETNRDALFSDDEDDDIDVRKQANDINSRLYASGRHFEVSDNKGLECTSNDESVFTADPTSHDSEDMPVPFADDLRNNSEHEALQSIYKELGEIYNEVQTNHAVSAKPEDEETESVGSYERIEDGMLLSKHLLGPRPEDYMPRATGGRGIVADSFSIEPVHDDEEDQLHSVSCSPSAPNANPNDAHFPDASTCLHERRFWRRQHAPVPEGLIRDQLEENQQVLHETREAMLHRMKDYLHSIGSKSEADELLGSDSSYLAVNTSHDVAGMVLKRPMFGPTPEELLSLTRLVVAPVVQGEDIGHVTILKGRDIDPGIQMLGALRRRKPKPGCDSMEPLIVTSGRFVGNELESMLDDDPHHKASVVAGRNEFSNSIHGRRDFFSYSRSDGDDSPQGENICLKQRLHSSSSHSSQCPRTESVARIPVLTHRSQSSSSQSEKDSRVTQILDTTKLSQQCDNRISASSQHDGQSSKITLPGSLVVRGTDVTVYASDIKIVQGIEVSLQESESLDAEQEAATGEVTSVANAIDLHCLNAIPAGVDKSIHVSGQDRPVIMGTPINNFSTNSPEGTPADPPGLVKHISPASTVSDNNTLSLVISNDEDAMARENKDFFLHLALSDDATSRAERSASISPASMDGKMSLIGVNRVEVSGPEESLQVDIQKKNLDEGRDEPVLGSTWGRLFCGSDSPSDLISPFTATSQHMASKNIERMWTGPSAMVESLQETARAAAPLSPCGSTCPPNDIVTKDALERRLRIHEDSLRQKLAGAGQSVFTDNETISQSEGMSHDSISQAIQRGRVRNMSREDASSRGSASKDRFENCDEVNECRGKSSRSKRSQSRIRNGYGDEKTAWDPSTIESESRMTSAVPTMIAVGTDAHCLTHHGVPLEIQVVDGEKVVRNSLLRSTVPADQSTVDDEQDNEISCNRNNQQYVARFGSASGEKDLGMPPKHGVASEASFQSDERSPRSAQKSLGRHSNLLVVLTDDDSQSHSDNESSLLLALTRSEGEVAESPRQENAWASQASQKFTKKTSFMSRVERARALALSPKSANDTSDESRMDIDFIEKYPNSIAVSSPRKEFTRSPRLQTVLDRLRERRKQSFISGDDGRRSFTSGNDVEHVDVDDLFSRYDNIVKHMVVLDDDRLLRAQEKHMHVYDDTTRAGSSRSSLKSKPKRTDPSIDSRASSIIDVTELMESSRRGFRSSKDVTIERRRSSSVNVTRNKPRQPSMRRANSFGSETSTPSQKARDLRKQLDQALKTSAKIRTTQERLGAELTTFKSRIQQQRDLSPAASRSASRGRSLSGTSSPSPRSQSLHNSTSSSGQSPSISDTNRALVLNAPVLSDRTVVSGEQASHHSNNTKTIPSEVSRSTTSKRSLTTTSNVDDVLHGDGSSRSFKLTAAEFDQVLNARANHTPIRAQSQSPRTRRSAPTSPASTKGSPSQKVTDDDGGSHASKNSHHSRNSAQNPINLISSQSLPMSEATSVKATSPANRRDGSPRLTAIDSPASRPASSPRVTSNPDDTLNVALMDVDVDSSDGKEEDDDIRQTTSSTSYTSEDEVKMMHLQSIIHGLRNAEERKNQTEM